MNTSQTILLLLQNKSLKYKNKFFIIVEVIFSLFLEKYFFISKKKALLQIQSEVLYAMEKIEKSKKVTHAWITTRLNLLKKNLLQQNIITPRTSFEVRVDFLEDIQSMEKLPDNLSLTLLHQTRGWNKKTYQRFERYVLRKQKKTQIKKKEVIQPTLIQGL